MLFLSTAVSRILAVALVVGAASPAIAQKRAPTAQYNDPAVTLGYNDPIPTVMYKEAPSTPLEKNFGLPTFGMQGAETPQQRTQAPVARPADPIDVFKGHPGFTGLNAPDPNVATAADGEPDFFKDIQEIMVARNQPGMGGPATPDYATPSYAAPDSLPTNTPLFTTRQLYQIGSTNPDMTTESMTTGRFGTGDVADAGDAPAQ